MFTPLLSLLISLLPSTLSLALPQPAPDPIDPTATAFDSLTTAQTFHPYSYDITIRAPSTDVWFPYAFLAATLHAATANVQALDWCGVPPDSDGTSTGLACANLWIARPTDYVAEDPTHRDFEPELKAKLTQAVVSMLWGFIGSPLASSFVVVDPAAPGVELAWGCLNSVGGAPGKCTFVHP